MSCRRLLLFLLLLALFPAALPALAHAPGESYLFLRIRNDGLEVRFQAMVQDLDVELRLDADHDGRVSQAEAEAGLDRVEELFVRRASVGTEAAPFRLRRTGHAFLDLPIGRYLELQFVSEGTGPLPERLLINYRLFFERDPKHRMLLVVEENQRTGFKTATDEVFMVFGPEDPCQELDLGAVREQSKLGRFVGLGVHHIAIGADHILFLVALLLPSVLVRQNGGWRPAPGFRPALGFVIGVVTLFTLAHSLTLSAAAFRVVELPSRLVESVIALSVALAAVNNLFPVVRERTWVVVFAFGLFHGFGFASVLGHLVFNRSALLVPLLGFNLGVELGQLTLILLVFPVLYALRRRSFYVPRVVHLGSVAIALVAMVWFVQRAFAL